MKLKTWISKHNFGLEVERLFNESVICYKAEAYRASLLFSYLGFMTILKDRILNSNRPTGFIEAEWINQYQNQLRDDGVWDKKIFECTQQKNKIIFDVSDELRKQVEYWKNRRNDCAHAKEQIIKYHHVESFWTFMYTNLPKFVVGGSFEHLIQKVDDHFNPNITPVSDDYTFLVEEIEHGIENDKLTTFFAVIESKIKEHSRNISATIYKRRHVDFWNKIFNLCNDTIKEKLIEYLKSDNERLDEFIDAFPNRIHEMNITYAFARNYWMTKDYISERELKIIFSFIRNSLIKQEDYEELSNRLVEIMFVNNLNDDLATNLDSIGYFQKFKDKFIQGEAIGDFDDGNRIRGQVKYIIQTEGFTDELTKTLIRTFNLDYIPFYLRDDLIELFNTSPELKNKFFDKARVLNLNQSKVNFWN